MAEVLVGALFRCFFPACRSVHFGPALGPETPLVAALPAWSLLKGLSGSEVNSVPAQGLVPLRYRRRCGVAARIQRVALPGRGNRARRPLGTSAATMLVAEVIH